MSLSRDCRDEAFPQLDAILRWPSGDAKRWAHTAFTQLCSNRDVLAVVLFGSTIRPANSSFDLDCLYIYKGEKPYLMPAPMEVDLRGYHVGQVSELIKNGHDLLGWSLRFGKLVCERGRFWSRLSTEWEGRLPLPSADVADTRAAKAERMAAEYREIGDEDAAVEQWLTAVTHRARATLLRAAVYPASRPELPLQLREIGSDMLADTLDCAIQARDTLARQMIGIHNVPEDAV